jgi:gluconate 2-dehydrogenase alpha chain
VARKLERVDVVLVGFGWCGSIMGQELTEAGLEVLALERGGWREAPTDYATTFVQDELRYAIRNELFQEPVRQTLTFRNNRNQVALPMRHLGSFNPGVGVGGAGVHWNGQHWRFLPYDFEMHSRTVEAYGADFIPDDVIIQDWGVTYRELEPYFDRFEYVCGTSGVAGNLKGETTERGNPFEGVRSREYPLPPLKRSYGTVLFDEAAREVGFHPFPAPASNTSKAYLNPYGVQMGECTYCGFCEWFGCGNYSKSSPESTILPALLQKPNFSYRTHCNVTRVNLDASGKRAVGVTYVDAQGREYEQPADIVILCAYATHNVHLLLLSGIGEPYDPQSGTGVVGRGYAYQTISGVDVFTGKNLNPFMGAGALGQAVDDFNGNNFDHGPHGFIGGGYIALWTTGARPIGQMILPEDAPSWGSGWKRAAAEHYLGATSISCHGSSVAHRSNYLDLDPTYRDVYGNPLLRLTFDFPENDIRMSRFLAARAEEIARAMNPRSYTVNHTQTPYSIVPYQTTHNTGGAVMGENPRTSVVNRYLQSWDVPNVFVTGACVFPQNAGYNPTGTVGALTYWAADAIRNQYLRNPGPLVDA